MTKKAEVGNKCRWGPFKEVCKAIESQEEKQVGLMPESNSIFKCILGPKIFLGPKKCWVQKILGPKKV